GPGGPPAGDRFGLLTGGPRTALPRHQTLRAAVDWSYDLLSPAERRLFERLTVFAGGFALEDAERVCADDETPVLDALLHLVDRSLVDAPGDRGAGRYRMLETLRQYGWERLRARGEMEAWRERHAAYYLALAEAMPTVLDGPEEIPWLDRLEREHDNLRAALGWFAARGDAGRGLR